MTAQTVSNPLSRAASYYWRSAKIARHLRNDICRHAAVIDLVMVAGVDRWPRIQAAARRHLEVIRSPLSASVAPGLRGEVISIG